MFAAVFMFLLGAGLVVAAYYAVTALPGALAQRRLDQRIEEVSHTRDDDDKDPVGLLKSRQDGPLPSIERMLGGTDQGSRLSKWVEQSGVKISLSAILLFAAGGGLIFGLIAASVMRMTVGWFVGGAIGAAMPFVVLNIKRKRRLRNFEENFPEALDLISRALKAGHAFATGLKMVADEMSEPIGPEFRKTFDEQNFGLPLKDALNNLTERIPLLDVRFFATAVLIQRETGGNLSEILENLAHVVRERFKILRQVRVYTAHGRLTGYVLLALPVFLVIALSFINPEHMQLLFRERIGHMLLGATVVMQTIGYFWIRQVVKIEV
ncbi:MAG TPA: type II secretion system F family protein [Vicinamibacterales bacterium]|jgi:tight adherence protein B|nr:type II secretion system F family protein [Vicinamibacterales bacterium]